MVDISEVKRLFFNDCARLKSLSSQLSDQLEYLNLSERPSLEATPELIQKIESLTVNGFFVSLPQHFTTLSQNSGAKGSGDTPSESPNNPISLPLYTHGQGYEIVDL